eukprot:scaffold6050_cov75-Skeletonema_dohrnii-CCMP3373.AAC.1
MSAENANSDTAAVICASCGIAEVDEIKLTKCDDCDLVRYCSDKCQQDHRMQHKVMCKERAAKLRDEILFRQPEGSHLGDCPICCLPLPLDPTKSIKMSCCSKTICRGCEIGNCRRQIQIGGRLDITCPFCRHPIPETKEEANKINLKRLEANDPVAIAEVGRRHCHEGEYDTAFEYLTKGAELGDVNAHYHLSRLYEKGQGVEKDEKKGLYHLEEAAIAAANLGLDEAIQSLKLCYKKGKFSKDDFASALRAHQAAVNEMKSPQREEATEIAEQEV